MSWASGRGPLTVIGSRIRRSGLMWAGRWVLGLAGWVSAGGACAGEARYAIIQMDGAGHGRLAVDRGIDRGASVHLQYPDGQGVVRCCKRVSVDDLSLDRAPEWWASDEVRGQPASVYRLRLPKLWYESPFIGLAVIGQGLRVRNAAEHLEAQGRSGRWTRAGLCTSAEGVHLQQAEGGVLRTHLYLGLGYAVEAPTCP